MSFSPQRSLPPFAANINRSPQNIVWCQDDAGRLVPVAADALSHRPAAYGLFLEQERVLLQAHPETGLLAPPGVIVESEESPQQALLACFRRLTGLTLRNSPLLHTQEQYRLDDHGRAWRLTALYFRLERPPLTQSMPVEVEVAPELIWVPLKDLTPERLQFGSQAVRLLARFAR